MLFRLIRICTPIFLILILSSAAFATTAANTVGPSSAGESYHVATANELKPPECASLDLSSIYVGGGSSGGNDLILGTSNYDNLAGGNGSDCILGGGTLDVLDGGGGDDIILGGPGFDLIFGGGGNDVCYGGDDSAWMFNCETTY